MPGCYETCINVYWHLHTGNTSPVPSLPTPFYMVTLKCAVCRRLLTRYLACQVPNRRHDISPMSPSARYTSETDLGSRGVLAVKLLDRSVHFCSAVSIWVSGGVQGATVTYFTGRSHSTHMWFRSCLGAMRHVLTSIGTCTPGTHHQCHHYLPLFIW